MNLENGHSKGQSAEIFFLDSIIDFETQGSTLVAPHVSHCITILPPACQHPASFLSTQAICPQKLYQTDQAQALCKSGKLKWHSIKQIVEPFLFRVPVALIVCTTL